MPAPSRTVLSRKLRALEKMVARASSRRRVTFEVKAGTAPVVKETAVPRCGVAEVDITPSELVAMAGYSLAGKTAKGVGNRLFARALFIDDGAGHTAALCFVDLWCASRYLLYQARVSSRRVAETVRSHCPSGWRVCNSARTCSDDTRR